MTRVLVIGCRASLRDRLREALESRGADLLVIDDPADARDVLAPDDVGAVVTDLETSPSTSGLAVLLSAQAQAPGARRVLVVERRAHITDAALASGLADRVVDGPTSPFRVARLAEWLVGVCGDEPTAWL